MKEEKKKMRNRPKHAEKTTSHETAYLLEWAPLLNALHKPRFSRFRTEPTRNGEWLGRFQTTQSLAFLFASLFRRTFFEHYLGYPVLLTREVSIDFQGNVMIVDRATALIDGLCGGPIFHGETISKQAPGVYSLRLKTLRGMNGMEIRNAQGKLIVEFLNPESEIHLSNTGIPPVYTALPTYRRFPCCHYAKTWKNSYTTRVHLAARKALEPGRETVFVTRLIPRAANKRNRTR